MPKGTPGAVYRYVDQSGTETIVGQFEDIPAQYRSSAREIVLPEQSTNISSGATVGTFVRSLDFPSVGIGCAIGLVFALVTMSFVRRGVWILKAALIGLVVVALGGSYLGWVRRSAGLSKAPIANPSILVEDAQKAARKMKERIERQRSGLRKIDRIDRQSGESATGRE